MKKFLQISGVIFWLQIIILIGFSFYLWHSWNVIDDENADFFNNFMENFLRGHGNREKYFLMDSFSESEFSKLDNILEKLGMLKDCSFENKEFDFNGSEVVGLAKCQFEHADAKINLTTKKIDGKWQISYICFESELLENDL